MQKPDWRYSQQQRTDPGGAAAEDIFQNQANTQHRKERYQHRNRAGDKNAFSEQPGWQHLQINRQAQVILPAVLEIGRQQFAFQPAKPIVQQVAGGDGLNGFVGEEKYRKGGQSDQTGDQIKRQCSGEQPHWPTYCSQ